MRRMVILAASVGCLLLSFSGSARAQAEAMLLLLGEAEAAGASLIDRGFNGLDKATVGAGYEVRSTVAQIRAAIEDGTLDLSNLADTQRDRLAAELRALIRATEGASKEIITEVDAAVDVVTSSLFLIVNDGIGSLKIKPAVSVHGSDSIDVQLTGAALSQLEIKDLKIADEPTPFSLPVQDDSQATLTIPLTRGQGDVEILEPIELPIVFAVEKPRYWAWAWLLSPFERRFATRAVILPRNLGSVTAVYSATEAVVADQVKVEVRETPKVQTTVRLVGGIVPVPELRRGYWSGSFAILASKNADIIRDSIRIVFNGNDGCHNSSTKARLGAFHEKEFKIDVEIASERKAGATCRGTVTATYTERTVTTRQVERRDRRERAAFGERLVFRASDATDGLTDAQIAYFEIESPLFDSGKKLLLPGERERWATVELDPSSGYSYVTIEMN